jgi:uncharacterized membrane protein YbjE (DUF340 family)
MKYLSLVVLSLLLLISVMLKYSENIVERVIEINSYSTTPIIIWKEF